MADEAEAEAEAVAALRARGVDGAEKLLALASPDQILTVCRRFDRRENVGPGLLVKWIREGDLAEPPVPKPSSRDRLDVRFALAVERYPVGSTVELHVDLQRRRYEWEAQERPCFGQLVVVEHAFPVLCVVCSECDWSNAFAPKHLVDGDGRSPEDARAGL